MYLIIDRETQETVAAHSHKDDAQALMLDYQISYGRQAYIYEEAKKPMIGTDILEQYDDRY